MALRSATLYPNPPELVGWIIDSGIGKQFSRGTNAYSAYALLRKTSCISFLPGVQPWIGGVSGLCGGVRRWWKGWERWGGVIYLVDAAKEYMGWIGAGADGAVEEDQLADVQRGVVWWEGGDAGYGVGAGNEGGWVGVLGGISMEWWGG